MYGKVDVILTEGDCEVGLESTVIDFTCMPARILRPGGVTPEALSKVVALDMNYLPKTVADDGGGPKSPGLKYRHYKPDAHVVLLLGDDSRIVRYINARAKSCGGKCAAAVFDHLADQVICGDIFSLGDASKPDEAATRLFECLRRSNEVKAETLFIMSPGPEGIGLAYRNRLAKRPMRYLRSIRRCRTYKKENNFCMYGQYMPQSDGGSGRKRPFCFKRA
jgi:L-threonylcarbamoyladenylate synthase